MIPKLTKVKPKKFKSAGFMMLGTTMQHLAISFRERDTNQLKTIKIVNSNF